MIRMSVSALVVCLTFAGGTAAQSSGIDGVWLGTYTSTHSPTPTSEVLIFKTAGDQVVGAYLSASQSAGTLVGYQSGANGYTFLVTQPLDGCPPVSGTLTATVNQGTLQYSFAAIPCQGKPDNGKGTAKIADAQALAAFPGGGTSAPPSNVSIAGLWNAVYTSTSSPNPTNEKLFFANFGSMTRGIYVSDSGATGILSGQVSSNRFALSDYSPGPPCPGRAVYQGDRNAAAIDYGFQATDCQGNIDIGRGRAVPAPR